MLPQIFLKGQQEHLLGILKVMIDSRTTKHILPNNLIFIQNHQMKFNLNVLLFLVVLIFCNLVYVGYISVGCAGACQ